MSKLPFFLPPILLVVSMAAQSGPASQPTVWAMEPTPRLSKNRERQACGGTKSIR